MDRKEVEGACMVKPSVTDGVALKLKWLPRVVESSPVQGEPTGGVLQGELHVGAFMLEMLALGFMLNPEVKRKRCQLGAFHRHSNP